MNGHAVGDREGLHADDPRPPFVAPTWMWPVFVLFAGLLCVGTLAWHLPMMLWDHIDLVPMYEAWQAGNLASSEFWRIHDGSHLHVAAYAILLLSTWASDGQPWLDCMISLGLLVVQAWMLMRIAGDGIGGRVAGLWFVVLLAIALNSGHLVNLQWGWQVAVFISTLGAVAAIGLLTRPALTMAMNLLAVALASLGVLGFSTTLAMFPVALGLIALRPGHAVADRLLLVAPWFVACACLLWWLSSGRGDGATVVADAGTLLLYVLNYLGAGVSRLATGMAPVWAVIALGSATWTAVRRWHPRLLPWCALMLFGIGCALLTALGRAAEYGADHAFVTRYVSFSSLFWFGWVGLMLAGWRDAPRAWRRCVRPLLVLLAVFLLANGIHMTKQARELHARAEAFATHVRTHYPALDAGVMEAAWGGRADVAHERLGRLHARGFAPFDDRARKPDTP